jgi:hypothetical protein
VDFLPSRGLRTALETRAAAGPWDPKLALVVPALEVRQLARPLVSVAVRSVTCDRYSQLTGMAR